MKKVIKPLPHFLWRRLKLSTQCLLGKTCLICSDYSDFPVCKDCQSAICRPQYRCKTCGDEMFGQSHEQLCSVCIAQPAKIESLSYIGVYDGVLAETIVAAKIGRQIRAVQALRYLLDMSLLETIDKENFNDYTILAVPIAKSRLMFRGFNLPTLFAADIAQRLELPLMDIRAVTLPFWVKKQSKLSKIQRQKNQHLYQINHKIPEKILIVDDIFTTGNTINELTSQLLEKGAKNVSAIVLSRSLMV